MRGLPDDEAESNQFMKLESSDDLNEFENENDSERLFDGQNSSNLGNGSSTRELTEMELEIHRKEGRIVYYALALCGAGFLFPYNSFISAVDYFNARYPNYQPEFYFALTYLYSTVLALFFNVNLSRVLSVNFRIRFGYAFFLPFLILVPILEPLIQHDLLSEDTAYAITLFGIVVIGIACGIQQGSFYGFSGLFPNKYTQAIMMGEGFAGILVSINRILTKAIFDTETGNLDPNDNLNKASLPRQGLQTSIYVYFTVSALVIGCCWIAFEYIKNLSFSQYYLHRPGSNHIVEEIGMEDINNRQNDNGNNSSESSPQISKWSVVKMIWRPAFGVFCIFLVTLAVYPGILVTPKFDVLGDWYPVLVVAIFNFFDFAGKVASANTSFVSFTPSSRLSSSNTSLSNQFRYRLTTAMIGIRFLFIPIIIVIVRQSFQSTTNVEMVFLFLMTILLSFSSGYYGSVSMMLAPDLVPQKSKELAGNLMAFFLLFGLSVGATIAIGLSNLVTL